MSAHPEWLLFFLDILLFISLVAGAILNAALAISAEACIIITSGGLRREISLLIVELGELLSPACFPIAASLSAVSALCSAARGMRRHAARRLLHLTCGACLLVLYLRIHSYVVTPPEIVHGWTRETNRNSQVYVKPGHNTLIHGIDICNSSKEEPLFLLIVVCSSAQNFNRRRVVRETWGSQENYIAMSNAWSAAKDNYVKNQNAYEEVDNGLNRVFIHNGASNKAERDVESIAELKMKMSRDVDTRSFKHFERTPSIPDHFIDSTPVFKLAFLLGWPSVKNNFQVQRSINEESFLYEDIIQEDFMDTYNNLTIKSIMMLKWFVTHCKENVRYLMKTDDDVFLNVPRIVATLRERSARLRAAAAGGADPEYYIAGKLFRKKKPVTRKRSKWYTARYMYAGKFYPDYLNGPGYLMTAAAARALYAAALHIPIFHLEDVFITGMCAARAAPPLPPQHVADWFSPSRRLPCSAYAHLLVHGVGSRAKRGTVAALSSPAQAERCERNMHTKKPSKPSRTTRRVLRPLSKKQTSFLTYFLKK